MADDEPFMSNVLKQFISPAHQTWFLQGIKRLRQRTRRQYGNDNDREVGNVLEFLKKRPLEPAER